MMCDEDKADLNFRWGDLEDDDMGKFVKVDMGDGQEFAVSDRGITVIVPQDFFEEQEERDLDWRELTITKVELGIIIKLLEMKVKFDEGENPVNVANELFDNPTVKDSSPLTCMNCGAEMPFDNEVGAWVCPNCSNQGGENE